MGSLSQYIQDKVKSGYSSDIIKRSLIGWGYNPRYVDEAINSIDKEEDPLPQKDNGIIDVFFGPNRFFESSPKYNLKKGIIYFLIFCIISFLVQTVVLLVRNLLLKEPVQVVILTNFVYSIVYMMSFLLLFTILIFVYWLLCKFLLKTEINLSYFYTALFFSLLPFIILNSISGFEFYNIIGIVNISFGVFNVNLFLLWGLFLMALALSKQNLSFGKALLLVFVPFLLLIGLLTFLFYDVVKINILWFMFQKF
jgi:hypothetical protein